jgi:hypothetical protein
MSMGILVLALVVHDRPLLFTSGSVRWMILMTERERLRFSGIAANMAPGRMMKKEPAIKEAIKIDQRCFSTWRKKKQRNKQANGRAG